MIQEPDENLTMSIAAAESCPSAPVYKYASLQEISDFKSVFRNFMQVLLFCLLFYFCPFPREYVLHLSVYLVLSFPSNGCCQSSFFS